MRRTVCKKTLPSCTIDLPFLRTLETFLGTQLAKLFAKDLGRMRELYGSAEVDSLQRLRLMVDDGGVKREVDTVGELGATALPRRTRRLQLRMELGRPELMTVCMDFPRRGTPRLEVSTSRESAGTACQKVADALQVLTAQRSNRHSLLNNRLVRFGLVALLPLAVTAIGWWQQLPVLPLVSYQGWLVILAALLALVLSRVFPLVSFRTERRIDLGRLGFVVLFAVVLSLVAGYILLQQQLLWPLLGR